ncbi:hypothetical protein BC936DRAFT_149685 [Jimgerdemannia flammicorona]|uniref:Uncharacterized protein n=1 Tax=Jimgerdemannia flammicorona TaxID=994334 RepID=A0A433D0B5_9FUNG|nr:hypothetical protein BC936DRAFT_149685 [Jimgerdemannia flammicorona]
MDLRILNDIAADPSTTGPAQVGDGPPSYLNPAEQVLCVDNVVNPTSLHAHLALLRWFNVLENQDKTLDNIFLIKAELRYMLWLNYLNQRRPAQADMIVPPIDVAYIWHAHLLSPFRYYEDILRLYPGSQHMLDYAFPLEKLHNIVTGGFKIDLLSEMTWLEHTHNAEPYVLTLAEIDTRPLEFICPWCNKASQVQCEALLLDLTKFLRLIFADRQTWAKIKTEKGPDFRCSHCSAVCSADTLSGRRFLNDVTHYQQDSARFLAGGILTSTTGAYEEAKIATEHQLLFQDHETTWQMELNNGLSWQRCQWMEIVRTLRNVVDDLKRNLKYKSFRKATIGRMRGSYMGIIAPFSIDLVAAVIRQRGFTKKMCAMNLDTQNGLASSVRRYFMFLMLMKKFRYVHTGHSFVPTLDIGERYVCRIIIFVHIRDNLSDEPTIPQPSEPYTTENLVSKYLNIWRILFGIITPLYGLRVIYKAIKLHNATRRRTNVNNKEGSSCGGGSCAVYYPMYYGPGGKQPPLSYLPHCTTAMVWVPVVPVRARVAGVAVSGTLELGAELGAEAARAGGASPPSVVVVVAADVVAADVVAADVVAADVVVAAVRAGGTSPLVVHTRGESAGWVVVVAAAAGVMVAGAAVVVAMAVDVGGGR